MHISQKLVSFKQILSERFGNSQFLDRYIELCSVDEESKHEKHHILPRSIFPEYIKNLDNIVRLSPYNHFVAHYLLAHLTKDRRMVFALNQMNRIKNSGVLTTKQLEESASMYAEFREELSRASAEMNSGKTMTAENKERLINRLVGKIYVVDIQSNEIVQVTKEEYQKNKHLYRHTSQGKKRDSSTREKISNKLKGRTSWFNETTGEIRQSFECPGEGFVRGMPEERRDMVSKAMSGNKFWINQETGEQKRSKERPGPEWKSGRIFNNHFKGKTVVFDLISGETLTVSSDSRLPHQVIPNQKIVKIGKQIFTSFKSISQVYDIPEAICNNVFGKFPENGDTVVSSKTFKNLTPEDKTRFNWMIGKKFRDIVPKGIEFITAKEFIYDGETFK